MEAFGSLGEFPVLDFQIPFPSLNWDMNILLGILVSLFFEMDLSGSMLSRLATDVVQFSQMGWVTETVIFYIKTDGSFLEANN